MAKERKRKNRTGQCRLQLYVYSLQHELFTSYLAMPFHLIYLIFDDLVKSVNCAGPTIQKVSRSQNARSSRRIVLVGRIGTIASSSRQITTEEDVQWRIIIIVVFCDRTQFLSQSAHQFRRRSSHQIRSLQQNIIHTLTFGTI